jgi:hypothetical protein
MKQNEEHPILLAVARTISDGMPVDWEALAAEHREIADDLRALRTLQEMQVALQSAAKVPREEA